MNMQAKNGILLEAGTNEIEVMEFTIAGEIFGINVAKVREIMIARDVDPMPHTHKSIEGVFKPRDVIITVVNLPQYLGLTENIDKERELFIVTSFNKTNIAFRVHGVVGIGRISWTDIQKPDKFIYGGEDGVVTGIAEHQGRLVTILDFEKIVADISPEISIQESEITELGERVEDTRPILIAEDSILLAKMITKCLRMAKYPNVKQFDNGQELWDYLEVIKEQPNLHEKVACIITDIEMPQMDGHRLTRLIKSDKLLKKIPVIIFSSLVSDEMRVKCKQVGADEQLSKPEIGHLISIIDHLLPPK